jgi:Ca2+-binding EF-hand superfamily protein
MGSNGPLFLRIHILVDGQPCELAWRAAVGRLYKHLDGDGDGLVTADELKRGSWLEQMRTGKNRFVAVRSPRSGEAATTTAPQAFSAAGLAEILRPFCAPLSIDTLRQPDDGSRFLLQHLDRDGDRKLSPSELDSAEGLLTTLDADEDGLLRPEELKPYHNPFENSRPFRSGLDHNGFILLTPGAPRTTLVRTLLDRYDGLSIAGKARVYEPDGRLDREEFGVDERSFAQADVDQDDTLDAEEILRFLERITPTLEIEVETGKAKDATISMHQVSRTAPPANFAARLHHLQASGGFELLFNTEHVVLGTARKTTESYQARDFYKSQFELADADSNKSIDKKEAQNSFPFAQDFALIDRNGDEKISEAEFLGFLDSQLELAASRTALQVNDLGRSLFDALDANRDGRLSARELRAAARRALAWDANGDGQLGAGEVPIQMRLQFDRSQPPLLVEVGDRTNAPDSEPPAIPGAPRWFVKMDRNHDGDVSPREFLGPRADFERIDVDHDGLIDASEAAKAQ